MPDDSERFSKYPDTAHTTVEKFRKDLKHILLKKGTLADLFRESDIDHKKAASQYQAKKKPA